MPTFAGENLARQLPEDPDLPGPDPDPAPPDPERIGSGRPNRSLPVPDFRQPYMPRTGLSAPHEWGLPDYILEGARRYPGLSPGPWMPQASDSRQLMMQTGMFFAQNGSIPNQLLAGQMLRNSDQAWKSFFAGRHAAANDYLEQAKIRQGKLAENTTNELRELSEAHAAFYNNPNRLQQEWANLAYKYNHPRLLEVLQTQGLKRAEEFISELHNNNLNSLSLIHQRLQNEELQRKNEDDAERKRRIREAYDEPSTEERQHQQAMAPVQGVNQETGIANEPTLGPANVSTDPSGGGGGATTYPWFPKEPEQQKPVTQPAGAATERPTAPQGGWPAGITPQNAPTRRAELVDYANRNGVSLPPADAAGLANWVAANQPVTPAPTTTPGAGAAAQTGVPDLPAATRTAGIAPATLDRYAWDLLETNRMPPAFTGGGKDFVEINYAKRNAIQARADQLKGWLVDLTNLVPTRGNQTPQGRQDSMERANRTLDIIGSKEPFLASRLRAMLRGDMATPSSGFGGNSPFAQLITSVLTRLDPNFDSQRYQTSQRTINYWNTGQGGMKRQGFNQAILHARVALDILKDLPNTQFPDLNTAINWVQTHSGHAYATEFEAVMTHFRQELTRAFRGSAGAVTDLNNEKRILSSNASIEQMRQYLRVNAELMYGALETMADAYNFGTNRNMSPIDMIPEQQTRDALRTIRSIPISPAAAARIHPIDPNWANSPQTISPREQLMINWLKANPNDPRAHDMTEKLFSQGLL